MLRIDEIRPSSLQFNTISPLAGADGALPSSNLNHLNPENYMKFSYEKITSRAVLQRVLPVDAAVPYFTLKTYVQERHRDWAERFYN